MGLTDRSTTQKPSGNGRALLVVALVSIVTAAATSVVIVHFWLLPTEAKAPVSRIVVKPKTAPVREKAEATTGDPTTEDGAAALQAASNAASAALSAVDAVRNDAPTFVGSGPGQHKSLNDNFNALETAANNLLQASGGDLKANQKVISAFTSALAGSISLATQISTRNNETDDSKQIAAQVADALGQIKDSMP